MNKLQRSDLLPLEAYAEQRQEYRARLMQHKKKRQLPLGDNARLYFEDRETIQYQIQEVLRVEKTFDAAGIEEELEAYNPLIPDGDNLKATFMLEFPDVDLREQMAVRLRGIEHAVWMQVANEEKVFAIANEDLSRDDGKRTSMVHFMRFQFAPTMIDALFRGAEFKVGIDHAEYELASLAIEEPIKSSLVSDFVPMRLN